MAVPTRRDIPGDLGDPDLNVPAPTYILSRIRLVQFLRIRFLGCMRPDRNFLL